MAKELSTYEKTAGIVGVKESTADHVFNFLNTLLMIVLCLIILYPLWYVIVASFTDPVIVNTGKFLLWPEQFYVSGYKEAFEYPNLWSGYKNTIIYTVVSVIVSLCATVPGAYALSRRDMAGRRPIMFLFTFTMFFNGGMIPMYLTIKNLNLYNTMWALVLPGAISAYNMIIARTFFQNSIPEEMLEAAGLDGASDVQILTKLILPLSKSILAVLTLYYAVGHWNTYFSAYIYLNSEEKFTLQVVLRNIISTAAALQEMTDLISEDQSQRAALIEALKYAIIVFGSLPVVALYPLVQKHFVKGVMIGSLKG